jgi:hypothetical protein
MFLFKVQLFLASKSETEPINTKSVVQHVIQYQVLLTAYYKADIKYCCCHATCFSGRIVDFTTHNQPFVYDTKYRWRHITKRFELNTVCKSFKGCKISEKL